MEFNNSLRHAEEVTKIWREYNKQITGEDYIGADPFKGIRENRPTFQTEILNIMFNHGYELGFKRAIEELERK